MRENKEFEGQMEIEEFESNKESEEEIICKLREAGVVINEDTIGIKNPNASYMIRKSRKELIVK